MDAPVGQLGADEALAVMAPDKKVFHAVDRPTFSESWYRVADLKPRLRPTVQIHRQHYAGRCGTSSRTLQQPVLPPERLSLSIHSPSGRPAERAESGNLQRTVRRLRPTQGEAIQLMGQLYVSNLLLSEVPPDAGSLLNRYRKRISREVRAI